MGDSSDASAHLTKSAGVLLAEHSAPAAMLIVNVLAVAVSPKSVESRLHAFSRTRYLSSWRSFYPSSNGETVTQIQSIFPQTHIALDLR